MSRGDRSRVWLIGLAWGLLSWLPCCLPLAAKGLPRAPQARAEESRRLIAPDTPDAVRRGYLTAVGARFVVVPAGTGDYLGDAGWEPGLATPRLEVWRRRR